MDLAGASDLWIFPKYAFFTFWIMADEKKKT